MILDTAYITSSIGLLHIFIILLTCASIITHIRYKIISTKLEHSLARRIGWNALGEAYSAFIVLLFLIAGLFTKGYVTVSPFVQHIWRLSMVVVPLWCSILLVRHV